MISTDRHQGLYTLQLCQPERGNALSVSMVQAIQQAIDEAIADPGVHSLLFSSSAQHFCTGFDLSQVQDLSDQDLIERLIAIERLLQSIWYAPLRSHVLCEGRAWGQVPIYSRCATRHGSVRRQASAFLASALGLFSAHEDSEASWGLGMPCNDLAVAKAWTKAKRSPAVLAKPRLWIAPIRI